MAWTPDVPFRHGLASMLLGIYIVILGVGLFVAIGTAPVLGAFPVLLWIGILLVSGLSIAQGYRTLTYPPLRQGP